MTPLELATGYMDALFGEPDLAALEKLLAPDLTFEGPLVAFGTAEEYLDALRASPPRGWGYELVGAFGDESGATLICRFSRPGLTTPMALHVTATEGRIGSILLIFDTGLFR